MRPLRLFLGALVSLAAVVLLVCAALGLPHRSADAPGPVGALLSLTSPGALFPPAAIISLTDDNSTFFLARPAAFGPALEPDGLSGPLWVGRGFGDAARGWGGELGCGDVPSWRHGDIQSLQESAAMAGKVALLMRGGCGFLAKVQWAQRRGAVAVIVGDDVRGGALVRMYAQGDTSNVTIPSLFTSHTTAHLLSSLLSSPRTMLPPHDMPAHVAPLQPGLLHALVSGLGRAVGEGRGPPRAGSRRIPSSGIHPDDQQNHFETTSPASPDPRSRHAADFVIGEQDWRDADSMLSTTTIGRDALATPAALASARTHTSTIVVPGSGEYPPLAAEPPKRPWWKSSSARAGLMRVASPSSEPADLDTSPFPVPVAHKGLWVTLTPTSMSTSPFFDTLLVLVVSPLVTLTVVYALLLLRSRIRRRRWRAPKSVVERLPVRTYQTISEASSSPTPEASSPTTPLLQHAPEPSTSSVSRPCSRRSTELPATSSAVQHASPDRAEEKRESGLAAWRRRYGGRQKECVVCLDEYEDGVSQVMSLPCGHEFHADCITPWLVTRRRTCPICKGDVVRSLSQSYHDILDSSPTSRSPIPFHDNLDDIQAQAARTRNDSPSASQPVPIWPTTPQDNAPFGDDVETGWAESDARHVPRGVSGSRETEISASVRELSSTVSTMIWRGFDAVRSTAGLQRRTPPEDVDRNR